MLINNENQNQDQAILLPHSHAVFMYNIIQFKMKSIECLYVQVTTKRR